MERRKARLVCGFTQQHKIDYEEIFELIADMATIRLVLVVFASQFWPLYQMDVKNAFLDVHGFLSKLVYIAPH